MKIKELAEKLTKHKKRIAVAESCTGGLLGGALTSVPGSSEYFQLGFITYSNDAKIQILGIEKEIIEKYGAVSSQTAEKMCMKVKEIAASQIGIGVTGIAGPGGGTKQKPVGLVYIGFAIDNNTYVHRKIFSGNRNEIRSQTVSYVINTLNQMLEGENK